MDTINGDQTINGSDTTRKRPLDSEEHANLDWWEYDDDSSDEYTYESSNSGSDAQSDGEYGSVSESGSEFNDNGTEDATDPLAQLNDKEIEEFQRESGEKLLGAWADIIERYSDPRLAEASDVIDLETGSVVEDHGHIAALEKDRESLWRPSRRRYRADKKFKGASSVVANTSMWDSTATLSNKSESPPVPAEARDPSPPKQEPPAPSPLSAPPTNSTSKICGNGQKCGRAFCFTCM